MNIKTQLEDFYLKGKDEFPNILLLHGLKSNGSEMKELGRYLNKFGYNVHMPIYPGHGESDELFYCSNVYMWYGRTLEKYKETDHGTENTIVIGLSMGGSFAIKLGLTYKLKGLVTLNAPAVGFTDKYLREEIEREFREDPDISRFICANYMYAFRKEYSDFIDEIGQVENLKKITNRTLIIQGLKDQERYIKSSRRIFNNVSAKKKEIALFKESDHIITIGTEKKELFTKILEFCKKIR